VTAGTERVAQGRAAALVVLALAGVGALLGLVWQSWSPPGPAALIFPNGVQPDETEAWAAADGRFAILVAAVGATAALVTWCVRSVRGPAVVLALAAGGLGGAALTAWVGHLVRGPADVVGCTLASGQKIGCTRHLTLSLHMDALLYLEPALALLLYAMLVSFAARDDLGRPDSLRDTVSVAPGPEQYDARSYGNAAGVPEQRDFPAQ
jgi:hypothetical protein